MRLVLRLVLCCLLLAGAHAAPPLPDWMEAPRGPVVDAQCNLETVENANSAQLHALLTELSETTFMRLIRVNLEGKCKYWGAAEKLAAGEEEEEVACESKAEDTAVPLCSVGAGEADPFGAPAAGADPFGADFGGATSPPTSSPVDRRVTAAEEQFALAAESSAEDCTDETLPSFWLDMCSNIPTNTSDYVNLQVCALKPPLRLRCASSIPPPPAPPRRRRPHLPAAQHRVVHGVQRLSRMGSHL